MPQALTFLASMVATFALLVMLGFSVFLAALAFKTNNQPDPRRRLANCSDAQLSAPHLTVREHLVSSGETRMHRPRIVSLSRTDLVFRV
jgi:hypothetical protein